MVDQEVVDILAEIKQRVVSTKSSEPPTKPSTNGTTANVPVIPANHDYASLTVLARTWDRLPPLVTNRTGAAAKLDLWIKAKLKTAFRWFTWEQINFNAATHQTFKELIESLAAQQQQLSSIQNQLISYEQELRQLTDQVDNLNERLSAAGDQIHAVMNTQETNFGALRAMQASQNEKLEMLAREYAVDEIKKQIESNDRFTGIVRELKERHEQILDEQRVSFKQLSLELSESQVLQDRARRELDARVSKLES